MKTLAPLTAFDFHHRLEETPGPALVIFTAPRCGSCRVLRKVLEETFGGRMPLFEVDVQQETALARAYELFHLPALLLFRDGRYHAEIQAPPTPTALTAAIEAALAAPAQEEP